MFFFDLKSELYGKFNSGMYQYAQISTPFCCIVALPYLRCEWLFALRGMGQFSVVLHISLFSAVILRCECAVLVDYSSMRFGMSGKHAKLT